MQFWTDITELTAAVREFVSPRYRPELHYMRGPGPASRRRETVIKARRPGSRLGGDATFAVDQYR